MMMMMKYFLIALPAFAALGHTAHSELAATHETVLLENERLKAEVADLRTQVCLVGCSVMHFADCKPCVR